MAISISLTVNGAPVTAEIEPHTLLVQFLRDQLRLTGTHIGCDTAQCGACTVHLNGRAIKSCNILAVQAEGASITTIEGLAKDGELHPMQAAFRALPRPAVRFLHTGHGDERDLARRNVSPISPKRTCAPSSTATCAAVRAITTSSRPCSKALPA